MKFTTVSHIELLKSDVVKKALYHRKRRRKKEVIHTKLFIDTKELFCTGGRGIFWHFGTVGSLTQCQKKEEENQKRDRFFCAKSLRMRQGAVGTLGPLCNLGGLGEGR